VGNELGLERCAGLPALSAGLALAGKHGKETAPLSHELDNSITNIR